MEGENKKPQNPSAYPSFIIDYRESAMQCKTVYEGQEFGMTLRDYFAAKAMQSFVTSTITNESTLLNKIKVFLGIKKYTLDFNLSGSVVSKSAYEVADAMLKEREKQE